jgi:hypothetical protein
MHANDANEKKVGYFDVVVEEPAVFSAPWPSQTSPCYGSIMHASAELKPYLVTLYFKAPPKGTGTIKFRTLIKVIQISKSHPINPN